MEITLDPNEEVLEDDHPVISVLSEEEAAIYRSAVANSKGIFDPIQEYVETHGHLNPDAPEVESAYEDVRAIIALASLIEEVASVRAAMLESHPFLEEFVKKGSLEVTEVDLEDE